MKVAVVGGGIAGLAAARRLERALPEVGIVLVERDGRLGGKIATERFGGFVVEEAPDSFLTRKPRGVGLCEELGLAGELEARRPEHERAFVRRGRRLHPLPAGLSGMIPTNLEALERSELLTLAGRERLALETSLPPAPPGSDESIASFVTRRLGPEAYAAIVEPLMTGIYGGDGELLSLQATFPQLRALELEYGSLLRGLASQRARVDGRPPFVTLRDGMGRLVDALASGFERTRVVLGSSLRSVRRDPGGYALELEGGTRLDVDGLVLALPAFAAADALDPLDDALAAALAEIPYASSVVVTLGYEVGLVTNPLDGYGYVVPRVEETDVLACTWTSQKWVGRAPEGAHLVRVYAGRFGGRNLTQESDADLLALATGELELLGLDVEPSFTRVSRHPLGMPQYTLGHLDRLAAIESALSAHPGLALAGAAYGGVGIPDCIRSGEAAADAVARALATVLR